MNFIFIGNSYVLNFENMLYEELGGKHRIVRSLAGESQFLQKLNKIDFMFTSTLRSSC